MRWVLVLIACSKPMPKKAAERSSELSFTQMRIVQYEGPDIVYRASAESAAGGNEALKLSNVSVVHRGWPETGEVRLTAKEATVMPKQGGLGVKGDVTITDSRHRKLTTQEMIYTPGPSGTSRVLIPGKIHVESPEVITDAAGVDGNPDTGEFLVKGPVDGTYTPDAR